MEKNYKYTILSFIIGILLGANITLFLINSNMNARINKIKETNKNNITIPDYSIKIYEIPSNLYHEGMTEDEMQLYLKVEDKE